MAKLPAGRLVGGPLNHLLEPVPTCSLVALMVEPRSWVDHSAAPMWAVNPRPVRPVGQILVCPVDRRVDPLPSSGGLWFETSSRRCSVRHKVEVKK